MSCNFTIMVHWDWTSTRMATILSYKQQFVYRFHVSPWEWWAQPQSGSLGGWSAFPPVWSRLLWKGLPAHKLAWPLPAGCPAMASLQWNLRTMCCVLSEDMAIRANHVSTDEATFKMFISKFRIPDQTWQMTRLECKIWLGHTVTGVRDSG